MSQSAGHSPSQSASAPPPQTLPRASHPLHAQDRSISKEFAEATSVPQQNAPYSPAQTEPPLSPSSSLVDSPKVLPSDIPLCQGETQVYETFTCLFFQCRV